MDTVAAAAAPPELSRAAYRTEECPFRGIEAFLAAELFCSECVHFFLHHTLLFFIATHIRHVVDVVIIYFFSFFSWAYPSFLPHHDSSLHPALSLRLHSHNRAPTGAQPITDETGYTLVALYNQVRTRGAPPTPLLRKNTKQKPKATTPKNTKIRPSRDIFIGPTTTPEQ